MAEDDSLTKLKESMRVHQFRYRRGLFRKIAGGEVCQFMYQRPKLL